MHGIVLETVEADILSYGLLSRTQNNQFSGEISCDSVLVHVSQDSIGDFSVNIKESLLNLLIIYN